MKSHYLAITEKKKKNNCNPITQCECDVILANPSFHLGHKPVLAGLGQNLWAAGGGVGWWRLNACPKKVRISARVSSYLAVSFWLLLPRICYRTEHRLSGRGFDRHQPRPSDFQHIQQLLRRRMVPSLRSLLDLSFQPCAFSSTQSSTQKMLALKVCFSEHWQGT